MVKSPRPWTNAPSIYKHPNKVTLFLLFLFFPAQEQSVMISTRVFSPPLLTDFPLLFSKTLSLLLSKAWHLCTIPVFPYRCGCISLAGEAIYKYMQTGML